MQYKKYKSFHLYGYRFFLVVTLAGLCSIQTNAQRKLQHLSENKGGNNIHQQRPGAGSQLGNQHSSNNGHLGNNRSHNLLRAERPPQNGSVDRQPRFLDRQPRVNSTPNTRDLDNHVNRQGYNYNSNRYNGNRNYPSTNRPTRYWPNRHYSAYNPGWRYAGLPRRNSIVTSFSFGFQTINYGGYGYRYCDGIFYRPYNNAFRVIAPPVGIFINVLPYGYRPVYVNSQPYYYYNGTFYNEYQSSYRVVAPPVGAIVESIPEGYETITIDGETYYKVDDVQYKPIVQENGEIWYEVLKVD